LTIGSDRPGKVFVGSGMVAGLLRNHMAVKLLGPRLQFSLITEPVCTLAEPYAPCLTAARC